MGCCVKNEEYTKLQKDVAKFAKAFSHPARVTIMELLVKKCNCICNDLVESLPLAQSTVSQHLKVLKDAGLIDGIEKAPAIEYHLNVENWIRAKRVMKDFFEE